MSRSSVERGQVFGFIGPNGAGKTTSMRILATLDCPQSGDAFIDGFSVIDDPDRVRRRLGFMPDYYGTYPNMNVAEYLDFFARSYDLRGPERTAGHRLCHGLHRPRQARRQGDQWLIQRHEATPLPGPHHDSRSRGARAR